ncbi:hypothetical protein [Cognatishimia sp. MH4019]|uniref:hypothetical protein n=1 Tax=Cognatishimia sp. MH4019 TaxID=2854030 RepID=UPI001CD225DA|nr:hypothetical protein [Cognatishimia sp. MH4019]
MTPQEAHWWLNLMTLLGIAVLAVPVWSLNNRRKRLKEVRDLLAETPDSFKQKVREIVVDKQDRDVSDWRRIDELCLVIGYGALLGSAVLRLFVPII